MRHASYYDFDNQYVSYYGMLSLQNWMDRLRGELIRKYPNKKLRIVHSVLQRAKHTALLMREILNGMDVSIVGDPRLNSDKLLINKEYVEQVVSDCEKERTICLILSHQPDIEYFCGKKLETSEYSCMEIDIEGKLPPETSPDDLPF